VQRNFVGGCLGAIVGLLTGIAYNTSAQTATLEGGSHHLTFAAVLGIGVFGGLLGAVLVMPKTRRHHDDE
jgi:hypothetical protein